MNSTRNFKKLDILSLRECWPTIVEFGIPLYEFLDKKNGRDSKYKIRTLNNISGGNNIENYSKGVVSRSSDFSSKKIVDDSKHKDLMSRAHSNITKDKLSKLNNKIIIGNNISKNNTKKNLKYIQTLKYSIPRSYLDLIFSLCQFCSLSLETAEASVITLSFSINKLNDNINKIKEVNRNKEKYNDNYDYYYRNSEGYSNYTKTDNMNIDRLLFILLHIFICSKMFDRAHLKTAEILDIMNHRVSKKTVEACEIEILKLLDYDLFLTDDLLCNKVGLYLSNIKNYFNPDDIKYIHNMCMNFIKMIYENMELIYKYDRELLVAGIVQGVILITTLEEGIDSPVTRKLSVTCGYSGDEIIQVGKMVIRQAIGKEEYNRLNF